MAGLRLRSLYIFSRELSFTFVFRAEIATMTTKAEKIDVHIEMYASLHFSFRVYVFISMHSTYQRNTSDRNTRITVSCHFMQMYTSSNGHASGLWLVYFDPSCLFRMSKDDVEMWKIENGFQLGYVLFKVMTSLWFFVRVMKCISSSIFHVIEQCYSQAKWPLMNSIRKLNPSIRFNNNAGIRHSFFKCSDQKSISACLLIPASKLRLVLEVLGREFIW